jgi:uncharacterized tellurite resistance protein B-like protein
MEQMETILEGHSDLEKGAYLGAIASLSTADAEAGDREMEYLKELCRAARLSEQQERSVMKAASDPPGEELTLHLDILKNSELKYPLIADLIAFARMDAYHKEDEEKNIRKIAQHLGIGDKQYGLLEKFATKSEAIEEEESHHALTPVTAPAKLKDKLHHAGINLSSLFSGLLGMVSPRLLEKNEGAQMPARLDIFGTTGLRSIIALLSGGRSLGTLSQVFARSIG